MQHVKIHTRVRQWCKKIKQEATENIIIHTIIFTEPNQVPLQHNVALVKFIKNHWYEKQDNGDARW